MYPLHWPLAYIYNLLTITGRELNALISLEVNFLICLSDRKECLLQRKFRGPNSKEEKSILGFSSGSWAAMSNFSGQGTQAINQEEKPIINQQIVLASHSISCYF